MKIGIFGDSYGARSDIRNVYSDKYENYPCWFEYLTSKYDITNYCKCGSSLFFSYDLFLKHHSKYDKIIFMVTQYGRLFLPDVSEETLKHVPCFEHLESNYKHRNWKNLFDKKLCYDMMNYLLLVQNKDEEKIKHRLIVEDIQEMRPDALLLPSYFNNESLITNYSGSSMYDISLLDQKSNTDYVGKDLRQCHMNLENNKIFSEKIEKWLISCTFFLDVSQFVKSSKSYDYYFGNN